MHVLDRVDPEAVQIELLQPPQRVGDEGLGGLGHLPVDVGHEGREQAVQAVGGPVTALGAADAAGVEPVRVLDEVGVLLVHVVDHKVHEHADAVFVGRLHHGPQGLVAAQAWIYLARLDGPVAVVARDRVDPVGADVAVVRVGVPGREPQGLHPQGVEVAGLDGLSDALQIAAEEVAGPLFVQGRAVVPRLTVDEAVGHDHVESTAQCLFAILLSLPGFGLLVEIVVGWNILFVDFSHPFHSWNALDRNDKVLDSADDFQNKYLLWYRTVWTGLELRFLSIIDFLEPRELGGYSLALA